MDNPLDNGEGRTLSVKQAAQTLQVSEKTVRRWIRDKRLEATQKPGPYGMTWHIPASAIHTVHQVIEVLPLERSVDPRTLGLMIAQAVTESNRTLMQQIAALQAQVTQLTHQLEDPPPSAPERFSSEGLLQDDPMLAQIQAVVRSAIHESLTPTRRSWWWPWKPGR